MIYTRHVGLDRDTNKGLLLKHIWANNAVGTPFKELRQEHPDVLTDKTCRKTIFELLDRMTNYLKTVKEEKL